MRLKIFYKIILLAFFPNIQLEYITVLSIYFLYSILYFNIIRDKISGHTGFDYIE